MRTKDFNSLLQKKTPECILEEYMMGKHGKLTENQLQKIIDKKSDENKGHGSILFVFKKRRKKK